MIAGGALVALLLSALFFPQASQVLLGWLPASISVLTGTPVPGDVRYDEQITVANAILQELPMPARESLVAQAPAAFDAIRAESAASTDIATTVQEVWGILVPVSVFFSLLFAMGIIFVYMRLKEVKYQDKKKYQIKQTGDAAHAGPSKMQLRWAKILEHANSTNENDWRHAILDADIMLDELLDAQGYKGDTMGDKLKQVERSDFRTIDLAWEAHKVRNKIAHEGSALSLSEREVRRVVALFEQVFREFHLV